MSIICTTPMCEAGGLSVAQMQGTFDDLSANSAFDRARFESTVTSIARAYADSISWYDPYIPFNPICCSIETLGRQADAVTREMIASVGGELPGPGPSTPSGGFDMSSLMLLAGMTLLVVYAGPIKDALR